MTDPALRLASSTLPEIACWIADEADLDVFPVDYVPGEKKGKILGYLLSDENERWRHKHRILQSLGFRASRPDKLRDAIRRLTRNGSVEVERGTRIVAWSDGRLEGPIAASKTVWRAVYRWKDGWKLITLIPRGSRLI